MKNPLLLDEADKRGEQHFYSRSSSCRKSFITFSRAMKEKNIRQHVSIPPQITFYGLFDNSHQKISILHIYHLFHIFHIFIYVIYFIGYFDHSFSINLNVQ